MGVEVKDFDAPSVISELEKTMGQLQLYQWALEEQDPERQLFLAVSQEIYLKHFQKPSFQLAIGRNKINLTIQSWVVAAPDRATSRLDVRKFSSHPYHDQTPLECNC